MSVEFDPVRLGRRRRRFEPAMIGVVVVAVALVAAIAKPWDVAAPRSTPIASPAARVVPDGTPASTPGATPSGPDWIAVTSPVTDHDAWGVTAVLGRGPDPAAETPGTARYTELWSATSVDPSGQEWAVVTRHGADVAALGVTVPNGVQPQGVRVWRLHPSNEFEWIDAARIDDQPQSRAPLLVRMPLLDDPDPVPWQAGQYRVDVLTGDEIHRISVVIDKQFGDMFGRDDWPTGAPDTVAATASDPSAIRIGLFATVDGAAVSIPARTSEPLGEVAAWSDMSQGSGPIVAATYLPRATGLGVMLTAHAAVKNATIRRLAPGPLPIAPEASGGISDAQGRTPYVVFAEPDGGVWTPGVYAVTVDWDDAGGAHHGTWHVALLPGVG